MRHKPMTNNMTYENLLNSLASYENYQYLLINKLEDAFWEKVKIKNDQEFYKKYLEVFPQGKYTQDSIKRVNEISQIEKIAITRQLELEKERLEKQDYQAYLNAQQLASIESYEKYLKTYPNGVYRKEAAIAIEKITEDFLLLKKWLINIYIYSEGYNIGIIEHYKRIMKIHDIDVNSKKSHDLKLNELPKEIKILKNLRGLDVSGNHIMAMPKEIEELKSLTKLNFKYNLLTTLPREIGNLGELTYLDISGNQLTMLPKEIGMLVNLNTLNLEGNKLTSLPKEICNLKNLTSLNIKGNKLTVLQKSLIDFIREKGFSIGRQNVTSSEKFIAIAKSILLKFKT